MGILSRIAATKQRFREQRIRSTGARIQKLATEAQQAKREKALLKTEQKLKKEVSDAAKLRRQVNPSVLQRLRSASGNLKNNRKQVTKLAKKVNAGPSTVFSLGGGSSSGSSPFTFGPSDKKKRGPFN